MKIRHIRIHNYRSIRDLELDTQDWMVFLGPNNHGKSNVLSAIEFFLSSAIKPAVDDFFEFRDEEDNELWVEILFDELTEQERHTFFKYVRGDNTVKIRKFARLDPPDTVEIGYRGYFAEPKRVFLKSFLGYFCHAESQRSMQFDSFFGCFSAKNPFPISFKST